MKFEALAKGSFDARKVDIDGGNTDETQRAKSGQRFLSEGQQALFPPAIGGLGESCVLPAVGSRGRGSALNAC